MLSDCQNLNRLTGNRGRLHSAHWPVAGNWRRAALSADAGLLVLSLTVEALQGNACQDSLISGGGRSVRAKISGEGVVPGNIFWFLQN